MASMQNSHNWGWGDGSVRKVPADKHESPSVTSSTPTGNAGLYP